MKSFPTIVLTIALGFCTIGAAQAQDDPVHIGYYNYSDLLFTTNLAKYVLEHNMDQKVKLTKASIPAVYQGVASGELDFFTEAWLPNTHGDYMKRYESDLWDVGALYSGTRLGWVVPDYVPKDKLNSIEDLKSKEVMKKLNGRIVGISPGAGLTRLSKKAMKQYQLKDFGYQLVVSSGPGMTAELQRAIKNHEWVVVTGWSPHWMFARWNLRYISDPKKVLGHGEHIDTLVRDHFYRDHPKVFDMLTRMRLSLKEVQTGMYRGRKTSYPDAAEKFVKNHPARVHYWVTGKFPQKK